MLIELQSHSTVSDGQLAPADVVAKAAEAGVTTLALTDHDAIAGVGEAQAAAEKLGIELVPAIEMSCVHEYAEDLHICGYWVDVAKIAPACERAQHERVTRAGEIVAKLREHGFDLHLEDAVREAGDALSIGRPHIARAGRQGLRPAPLADRRAGDRANPRSRRHRRHRPSLLGHLRAHRGRRPDPFPRCRRRRDLLPDPLQGADRTPP
jgi:predicted metal-dependent phosphoesterase TrpH